MENNILRQTPPATLNLIIINFLILFTQYTLGQVWDLDLSSVFGLHFFLAPNFRLWQLGTYMFLHGGLTHLLFNMFALWMFGVVIERTLGTQRFLLYYFICGIGAGLCQEAWQLVQYYAEGLQAYQGVNIEGSLMSMDAYLNLWTTVGASGACYGVLLAFGVLYPNERIMLLIPPIPMKAKYFVFAYACIELVSAFTTTGNIAHFAHLGGMFFGWLLLLRWRKQSQQTHSPYSTTQKNSPTVLQRIRNLFPTLRNTDKTSRPTMHGRESDYEYNLRKKQEEERLDAILDKIKRSGYDSLTEEEKRELFHHSQR